LVTTAAKRLEAWMVNGNRWRCDVAIKIKQADGAIPDAVSRNGYSAQETSYMKGGQEPATSSVLISNSKYLNSPLYRDVWTQMSLRRFGPDLPVTYDIPAMSLGMKDVTDFAEFYKLIEMEKLKNLDFADWLAERRYTSYASMDLSGYAEGTLGANIRAFLSRPGFDMEFINKDVEPANDIEYLLKRSGSNHDIDHMVTGFGPSLAGEQALSTMSACATFRFLSPDLARLIAHANCFVTAASLQRASLHYPAGMELMYESMRLGIVAGQSIRMPLFMVPWEDYLDWQLEDIAAALGFTRGPGDAWQNLDPLLMG
jgi:ubiquinone biosynthesis protein COQ4